MWPAAAMGLWMCDSSRRAEALTVDGVLATALAGFGTGFGLIVAIGAQNAFVLRQGLHREHVGVVVAICALSDLLLIAVGAGGVGALVDWRRARPRGRGGRRRGPGLVRGVRLRRARRPGGPRGGRTSGPGRLASPGR